MSVFFRNALIYRLTDRFTLTTAELNEQLARLQFTPGTAVQAQSFGWVPSIENGDLAHAVGGQLLLTLRVEKKLLPASVINQFVKQRALEAEERQGYKPGRKQLKEIKEIVTEELLPKAFSIFRDTRVWIDPVNGWVAIDTTSTAKAEELIAALSKSIDPFPLAPLQLAHSPAQVMTAWLASDEAPAGFTIDQDTELRASGDSRAAVRYMRQSIEADEVRKHIDNGKRCTRLALTWSDRVSFVLTDPFAIKRIQPLDVIKEGEGTTVDDDARARFDSDFAMMTGELSQLFAALVESLGGLAQTGDAKADAGKIATAEASQRKAA